MYYHVRIDYLNKKLKGIQTKYGYDYANVNDVMNDVLVPYVSGKGFIFQGCSMIADDVNQIRVFQTEDLIERTVAYANEKEPNNFFAYENHTILEEYRYANEITRLIFKSVENEVKKNSVDNAKSTKSKKIFISHSSQDAAFAAALIKLLNSLGFGKNDIFCSSVPGYWIEKGNFFDVIRRQFEQHDLYMVFIHSPRYYSSYISLNEMGAAWGLRSRYCSFLTKDMEYSQMMGVVNGQEIAYKVDDPKVKYRLNDWQKDLLNYFGKKPIDDINTWEQNRDEFLETVRNISYPSRKAPNIDTLAQNTVKLSEEDEKYLKRWVASNNNKLRQAWDEGDGVLIRIRIRRRIYG